MIIRSYPENFASALEPVVYTMDAVRLDAWLGANLDIMQHGQSTPVGTKRFYKGSKLSINIAPYALACLNILPYMSGNQLIQATGRTAKMYLTTDGELSEVRHIAAGRMTLPVGVLLSDRALRCIAPGEFDEFSFIAPEGDVWAEFSVSDAKGLRYSWRMPPFVSDGGMVVCPVDMRVIARMVADEVGLAVGDINKVKVVIYFGSDAAFEVNYVVEAVTAQGVRLAWISRYGTVECYTFPICTERKLATKRLGETQSGDGVTFPLVEAWQEQTISSGLLPSTTVQCLSDIVVASKVWQWKDGSWGECNIMDSSVVTHNVNEPSVVRLTVRDSKNVKTKTL